MSDTRPRPEYGEYATPEEQAKAMGITYVPAPPAGAVSPASPTAVPPLTGPAGADASGPPRAGAPARHPLAPHPSDAADRPQRSWNLMVTVTLLTLGGLWVLQGFAGYTDLAANINLAAEKMGVGRFTATESTRPIGIAIAVSSVVLYVISLAISVGLLRARRIAFWVPLAGWALWAILAVILMFIVFTSDPAFITSFTNR